MQGFRAASMYVRPELGGGAQDDRYLESSVAVIVSGEDRDATVVEGPPDGVLLLHANGLEELSSLVAASFVRHGVRPGGKSVRHSQIVRTQATFSPKVFIKYTSPVQ
jgi:xanthine dehydrogenase molybdopterin-binding subunit B